MGSLCHLCSKGVFDCSLFLSGISSCTAGRSKDRNIPHYCSLLPADQVRVPLVNPVPNAEVPPFPEQVSRIQKEGSFLLPAQPQPYS